MHNRAYESPDNRRQYCIRDECIFMAIMLPPPPSVYVFAFLSFDVFTQLFQRFKLENISFTPFIAFNISLY